MTHLIDTSAASIARAAECVRGGGLVAFPTETVYGLGVHALDAGAVRRLFEAKGRPADDPLIVHVASAAAIGDLVTDLPPAAARLGERFWPGPLTLVLRKAACVPREVTAGLDTVAVRVPAHPVALALIEAAGVPVAAPSANLFGRPSPTSAAHVMHDLAGRIDLVVDGGSTTVGVESTVLDLTSEPPAILRPGAVTLEMLREAIGNVRGDAGEPAVKRSPGMMAKHYAPRAPLLLFTGGHDAIDALVARARHLASQGRRVGVLGMREDVDLFGDFPVTLVEMGSARDLAGVAARFYAALRDLDAAGVDVILAREPEAEAGLGHALRDRLRRAASEVIAS